MAIRPPAPPPDPVAPSPPFARIVPDPPNVPVVILVEVTDIKIEPPLAPPLLLLLLDKATPDSPLQEISPVKHTLVTYFTKYFKTNIHIKHPFHMTF